MSQTSFSLYNFEATEKNVMNHVTKLNYQQMERHRQFLDTLLDPLLLCETHSEIFQFYNENGFYCSKCIVRLQGQQFKVLSDIDENALKILEQKLTQNRSIADVSKQELPEKDFSTPNATVQYLLSSTKFSPNRFQNDTVHLKQALENRDQFVKNKEFIHHVSRDTHSHKAHQELHVANKLDISMLEGNGKKAELIDELIRGFLQGP